MLTLFVVLLLASGGYVALWRYRTLRASELSRYFISRMLSGDASYVRYATYVQGARSNRAKLIAAESIAHLSSVIYRIDESPLLEVSRVFGLESFLLERAQRGGLKRIESLMLLSQIPLEELRIDDVERFRVDKMRIVRFMALMCIVNIEKERIVQHLATYRDEFTPLEICTIIETLRRGTITIAYQPLLASHNCNLNLVGIALVRHFGIETSCDMLASLVEQCPSHRVQTMALDALTAMQQPVAIPALREYIVSLNCSQRYTLLRHIAAAGYSEQALKGIVTTEESRYYCSIVNSYKVNLRCY